MFVQIGGYWWRCALRRTGAARRRAAACRPTSSAPRRLSRRARRAAAASRRAARAAAPSARSGRAARRTGRRGRFSQSSATRPRTSRAGAAAASRSAACACGRVGPSRCRQRTRSRPRGVCGSWHCYSVHFGCSLSCAANRRQMQAAPSLGASTISSCSTLSCARKKCQQMQTALGSRQMRCERPGNRRVRRKS